VSAGEGEAFDSRGGGGVVEEGWWKQAQKPSLKAAILDFPFPVWW